MKNDDASKKIHNLPEPECESGYSYRQILDIFNDEAELSAFHKWMYGQTQSLCEGRRYNHETREYEVSCGGVAHGGITYAYDLHRYLGLIPGKEDWD